MSWPRVKLSDVATINPRLPRDVDESQQVTFVAMASASEDGHLLASEARVLSETKKGFTYFDRSDVLLAKITPCFENGKCLRPGQIPTEIGFGSTEFHVIRPDTESLDSLYLFYLVWSEQFRFLGEKSMSGAAGQKRVGSDFLKGFEIPLPPLPEQKRIAAILDKADAIRRKRQQAIQLADDFLRAVFLDMFGDPVTNPKGWPSVKLGEVCGVGSSKRVFVDEFTDAGVPFYRGTEVGALGEGQKIQAELFISQEHYDDLVSHSGAPEVGDLLLPSICHDGRIWKVNHKEQFYFKDGRVLWIKLNRELIDSDYLRSYLQRMFLSNYSAIASGTTFAELKIVNLKAMNILSPPLALQRKFSELVKAISESGKLYATADLEGEDLFSSLAKQAFSGQL
ncbi:restriction endonuclease subunit S [Pseudomonas ceruminis]|uniref:restriction endonuclease subunit S n=1 Tax=Pseudomonas ceruminis TaxID=2740516 RepID=UPI001596B2F4|nr:restriction endonuclease subunit S [Pseudomonas ceruminis]